MDVTIDAVDGQPTKFSVSVTTNDWERRNGLMTAMEVIVPRHEIPEIKTGPVPLRLEMSRARFDDLCARYGRIC